MNNYFSVVFYLHFFLQLVHLVVQLLLLLHYNIALG